MKKSCNSNLFTETLKKYNKTTQIGSKNIQSYVSLNGIKRWRDIRTGAFHRLDGPAIIYPNGTEKWYWQGRVHRMDGPAIIFPNKHEWWYNGNKHSFKGWCSVIGKTNEEIIKLKLIWGGK